MTGKRDNSGAGHSLKGLILSGGKGSRLRPFTYTNAKQLVPIANKPVLFYVIEQLVECGITDIGIIIGDTGDQVKAAVGDGSAFGARVHFIRQEAPLGIAHAVKIARGYLGDSPFVLCLGDNFIMGGIKPYLESFLAKQSNCQILLHPAKNPQAFGVAEFEDGRLARIVEKPAHPPTNLAVVGVYMLDHHVFPVIEELRPSSRGELEIADALQGLIDRGLKVDFEVLDRYWIDTGKMDDILEANRAVLETLPARIEGEVDGISRVCQPIIVERGARVVNSTLRGPLAIDSGAQIIDCDIGPYTAIGPHCRLNGIRIANSVVMEHTTLEDIHWPVEHSLIGRHVTLRPGHPEGGSYSLTLGDYSQVHLPGT